jgi:hypothetical protein
MLPDSDSEIEEKKQSKRSSPSTRVLVWTAAVAACIAVIAAFMGQLVTIGESIRKLWSVDPPQIAMQEARASQPTESFKNRAGRGASDSGEPTYVFGIRAIMDKRGTPAIEDCMGQVRLENGDQFNAIVSGVPRLVEGAFKEEISYSFEIPRSVYSKRIEFRVWCENTKIVSSWLSVELIRPQ